MEFLCRSCGINFRKKLTLKEKFDCYTPKFCGKNCALTYTHENKKKRLNTPQTSKEERQFGEMVKSFLPKLESQWRFKDYDHHYDFYSPEYNLIIEYNGEYWHNKPRNIAKDKKHLLHASKHKVPVAVITDREWKEFLSDGMPDKKRLLRLLNISIKNAK